MNAEAPGEEALREVVDAELGPRLLDRETYLVDPLCPTVSVKRADRSYVWDVYGNEHLDFSAAGGSMVLGHNNGLVQTMLRMHLRDTLNTCEDQSEQMLRYPVEYARALSTTFPVADPEQGLSGKPLKVMFCEGEREAIQQALYIGRHSAPRSGISVIGGHRYGWLSAFGNDPFTWISANKPAANHDWDRIGVLLIDPIHHDYSLRDPAWLASVIEIAHEHSVQVVVDETITGFGRTGHLWAHTGYGITPDITVLGQAGGAGLPFGAVVACDDVFATGPYDPSRGGGNSLVCAMGATQLRQIDDPLLRHVRAAGQAIETACQGLLEQFPQYVCAQSGIGMLRKLSFVDIEHANIAYLEATARGLLLAHPYENSELALTPPLITTERECQRGVDILAAVMLDWGDRPQGWEEELPR